MKKLLILAIFANLSFASCMDIIPEIIGIKLYSFFSGEESSCKDNMLYITYTEEKRGDWDYLKTKDGKDTLDKTLKKMICSDLDIKKLLMKVEAINYKYKLKSGEKVHEVVVKKELCK